MKRFKPSDIVCARGTMSDDMQMLISGELGAMSDDGICLAVLTPITTVGEMGMITRQQRSAQVEALQTSQALVIARRPFEMLLNSDVDFSYRFISMSSGFSPARSSTIMCACAITY
jgi:CRP-like cAMP-binding protein